MKMKRAFLVFLSCLMAVLVACSSGNGGQGTETSGADTTEKETVTVDDIEIIDYNGYDFTFYTRSCCTHKYSVFPDAEETEIVNEAAYARNEKIYELLNVQICEPITENDGYPHNLAAALQAGEETCDAILWHRTYAASLAVDGMLLNMANLEHFSFDEDWWASNLIDQYSYKDAVYLAAGHYTTDIITDVGCLGFNATMFDNIFDETDIYQEVIDGNWTLDRLNYYLQNSGSDLNNDGSYNADDIVSISASYQHFFQFQYGAGQYAYEKDETGVPNLTLNNERTFNIIDKVYSMMVANASSYSVEIPESATKLFTAGRALFTTMAFRELTLGGFRDEMTDEFGVLPYPKYDEEQIDYYARLFAHSSLFALPYLLENPERSAHISDVMAKIGYEEVTPVMYEDALKVKYSSEGSWQMMDIIMNGITADFGDILDDGMVYVFDHLIGRNQSMDFASYYAEREGKAIDKLTNVIKSFELNSTR